MIFSTTLTIFDNIKQRMMSSPTLLESLLWCMFWSMTKNQWICQQCHPWFSPPLLSKSLLTEGWCFAGILGRASLTEGPIYCKQTIDTVRLILCFTCRPVHPGLDIWPWPLRSLLVDLQILLKISKHMKTSLSAALDMNDLSSKRFRLKNTLLAILGFKKHFRVIWYDVPHKLGHFFVYEVFNFTLGDAISRKEIELLYSFPCAVPHGRLILYLFKTGQWSIQTWI